ncbi:energy transducer TonB [Hymenobacter nivis]|uniref:TonB family protein n=1 Tax=Hymenobacter nivis TaxID=1850093 RepID=A0A502GNU6_9BACT|nr:TonB family protein [Hymenobacter nivis]TPG63554.1 TonB family protein [Hymenobacter nivis]
MERHLLVLLFCYGFSAKAQGTGEIYAAPGMAVHLQSPKPPVPVKKKEPPLLAVLPRFWYNTDSIASKTAQEQLLRTIQSQAKYPFIAEKDGVEGIIFVRVVIAPDGQPIKMNVIRRSTTANNQNGAVEALDAESIRAISTMKFEPKIGATDTITIPINYFIR